MWVKAGVISTKPRGARKPNRNTMNGTEGKTQAKLFFIENILLKYPDPKMIGVK